jgi:hypothetical protein
VTFLNLGFSDKSQRHPKRKWNNSR